MNGISNERFKIVVSALEFHGCGHSLNLFPELSKIELVGSDGEVFESIEVKERTVVINGTDEMPLRNYLGY